MGGFFSSEIDFSWTQNAWLWNYKGIKEIFQPFIENGHD